MKSCIVKQVVHISLLIPNFPPNKKFVIDTFLATTSREFGIVDPYSAHTKSCTQICILH